ncbi:MAG: excinuclease ABC subunit UvrA [Planctomycetes bacterium]|nr:excinuclease ABC subunit UvrA [Planctomycetota bacterium]
MKNKHISIKGARMHNLKNIEIDIPRDKLVVITGVSGSGKSSLAFDTIYAEGQRRYIESLSAYARQFLEQMAKPEVEHIRGLPPTISIEQRSGVGTPRSIVATATEIYDYLRVLFARVGQVHCYKCQRVISRQSAQQIIDQVLLMPAQRRIMILAPLVRGRKGQHREIFEKVKRSGFRRVRVDGKLIELDTRRRQIKLNKNKKHNIETVIDRLITGPGIKERLSDSLEMALQLGDGLVIISEEKNSVSGRGGWSDTIFSEHFACPECGVNVEEVSPRMFSFNSPYGACPVCNGLGSKMELDEDLIVPDKSLTLSNGAIEAWRKSGHRMAIYYHHVLRDVAHSFDVSLNTPFFKLAADQKRIMMIGTKPADEKKYGTTFEGVIPGLERRFRNTTSDYVKNRILSYMSELPCPACNGARLKPESQAVRIGGKNIYEITRLNIEVAARFFKKLSFEGEDALVARPILKEITNRLSFMVDVGLSYLTLDRKSATLAGGEAQRIRLASQVGSGLVGVCYVLDEPTIGLHQRDNNRLLTTLKKLRDLGNTIIVVEHDEDTIRAADYIIDIGPEAGAHGGRVVSAGSFSEILKNNNSLTAQYLKNKLKIAVPAKRRPWNEGYQLEIQGARANNLKNINVRIPLGIFCCVTGVSGSGKSTLVEEVLYKALKRHLYKSRIHTGEHDRILGVQNTDKVIVIDQLPIGRTPRSNPATYTGVFDEIRHLYASVKESKIRGYQPGRFSFNLKGGRCASCEGQGTKEIEMHFLPDVHVVCEACKGQRYNRETLEIKYKGKNIAEVLEMEISEALVFFRNFPKIVRVLQTLEDVGLGYMAMGQSSTTLSGGEAQRIKLSAELGRATTGRTIYIMDEPTTGLHFSDINKLLKVLNRLVDMGNTILVVEHNLDVIKTADYIIDLGPEGGDAGGKVVAAGTPEEIAKNNRSYTGQVLKRYLR